eukprot:2907342-Rhodomonas_salina.2
MLHQLRVWQFVSILRVDCWDPHQRGCALLNLPVLPVNSVVPRKSLDVKESSVQSKKGTARFEGNVVLYSRVPVCKQHDLVFKLSGADRQRWRGCQANLRARSIADDRKDDCCSISVRVPLAELWPQGNDLAWNDLFALRQRKRKVKLASVFVLDLVCNVYCKVRQIDVPPSNHVGRSLTFFDRGCQQGFEAIGVTSQCKLIILMVEGSVVDQRDLNGNKWILQLRNGHQMGNLHSFAVGQATQAHRKIHRQLGRDLCYLLNFVT